MKILPNEAKNIVDAALKHADQNNQKLKNLSPSQKRALIEIIDKVEKASEGKLQEFDVEISPEKMDRMKQSLQEPPAQGERSFFLIRFFKGIMNALHLRISSQSIVDKLSDLVVGTKIKYLESNPKQARSDGSLMEMNLHNTFHKNYLVSLLRKLPEKTGGAYLRGVIESNQNKDPSFVNDCLKLIHEEFSDAPQKKEHLYRNLHDAIDPVAFWAKRSQDRTEINQDPQLKEATLDFCEFCLSYGVRYNFTESLDRVIDHGTIFAREILRRENTLSNLTPQQKQEITTRINQKPATEKL